tara:strand:+ start:3334 stop:3996 length:663 start_codon:yes stop_codon:yes gene_type:complete
MHITVQNLSNIKDQIQSKIMEFKLENYSPNIIAVSKTFKVDHIKHLLDFGHIHFGENKVQEALDKWTEVKQQYPDIKLHMLGKLQSNKVKNAVKIFDYIHSVDNPKLVKKISEEQNKNKKKIKVFLQVNIGDEIQKSGVKYEEFFNLLEISKSYNLDVIGSMCIPPDDDKSEIYFSKLKKINDDAKLQELSMGMSNDFLKAVEYKSTFLRIGSKIFGNRS